MKLFDEDDTPENRLKKTMFIVEATSFEQHVFWQQYAKNSPHSRHFNYSTPVTWEQMDGWAVQVGTLDKRPCMVTMTWIKIDGCVVMFYDQTSQVSDSVQTEKWIEKYFNPTGSDARHRAQCDSSNFARCIQAIKTFNETNKS